MYIRVYTQNYSKIKILIKKLFKTSTSLKRNYRIFSCTLKYSFSSCPLGNFQAKNLLKHQITFNSFQI